MKEITAYRCDFCGKVYLTQWGCKRHEERGCCQRPERRPLCYSCQHYHQEMSERENITYCTGAVTPWGEDIENMKKFDINRCTHPDNECKLYNNFKLSGEMQEGLSQSGFEAMPTPETNGCQFYQPIDGHPWAKVNQLKGGAE